MAWVFRLYPGVSGSGTPKNAARLSFPILHPVVELQGHLVAAAVAAAGVGSWQAILADYEIREAWAWDRPKGTGL